MLWPSSPSRCFTTQLSDASVHCHNKEDGPAVFRLVLSNAYWDGSAGREECEGMCLFWWKWNIPRIGFLKRNNDVVNLYEDKCWVNCLVGEGYFPCNRYELQEIVSVPYNVSQKGREISFRFSIWPYILNHQIHQTPWKTFLWTGISTGLILLRADSLWLTPAGFLSLLPLIQLLLPLAGYFNPIPTTKVVPGRPAQILLTLSPLLFSPILVSKRACHLSWI